MSTTVADLIQENKVVMFSWVHCPFCVRAKDILKPLVKDLKVYECDEMSNGEDLRAQLLKTYKHETVPAIFIEGEFIGGCSELQVIEKNGVLAKKLA